MDSQFPKSQKSIFGILYNFKKSKFHILLSFISLERFDESYLASIHESTTIAIN